MFDLISYDSVAALFGSLLSLKMPIKQILSIKMHESFLTITKYVGKEHAGAATLL